MEKREGPTLPQGALRRNGVIPFQMLPPVSSATHLDTPAHPKEQKRLGGPLPGVTPNTAANAATVETTEPAPKKRLCGPSPFATLGTAARQSGLDSLSSSLSTTDSQGPPHGITPWWTPSQPDLLLSLWAPSQPNPLLSDPPTIVPASQQLQQPQRETSALDDKLAGAKMTIARQKIKKAGSKRKESATEPRIHYVIPRKSARYQDPQEIAKLSVNFDFLEARYREVKRTLEEAEGNTIALFQWHGKYGRDVEAWTAQSNLVEEVGDTDLRGRHINGHNVIELLAKESELLSKALLTGRQKQAQPGMPPTKVTTRSTPRDMLVGTYQSR
ncbi:hypothetical protein N7535_003447 [Penicillium sp. DV-2018c]|nr:hypothetical protein N7535_003447 [Penicillium sp. DV-2018c]